MTFRLSKFLAAAAFAFAASTFTAHGQDASAVKAIASPVAPALIPGGIPIAKKGAEATSNNKSSEPYYAVPEVKDAADNGAAKPDMPISLQLVLRRSEEQEQALRTLVARTMNPKDTLYAKTLTPTEFATNFGLSKNDLAVLTGWLQQEGFTVIAVDNGRLTINLSGTVAQAQNAFQTSIHMFTGLDGQEHYANISPWSVPAELFPVVRGLEGLQSFTPVVWRNFDGPVTDIDDPTITPSDTKFTAQDLHLEGDLLLDASFTAAQWTMPVHGKTVLNVRLVGNGVPVTGSLIIRDDAGHTVAFLPYLADCLPYGEFGRSCSIAYTSRYAGATKLTATYSGDEHARAIRMSVTPLNAGASSTQVTVTTSPITFNYNSFGGATANGTVTAVLAWAETGTAPTGTLSVTETTNNRSLGSANVALTTAQTCSAYSGSCSVTCTPNATSQNTSCAFTLSAVYSILPNQPATGAGGGGSGANTIQASYGGDSNYAASSGTTQAYKENTSSGSREPGPYTVTSITSSSALASATYGLTTAESPTVSITGSVTGYDVFGNSLASFVQAAGNGPLGSMGYYTTSTTSTCTSSCSFTLAFTVPALVTPSTTPYAVTYQYSGNIAYAYSGGYFGIYSPSNSAVTYGLTVSKQTPTITSTTATPTVVQSGSSTAISLSTQLNWAGVGVAPTGAVTFAVTNAGGTAISGSPFSATCSSLTSSGSGNSETNSYTCTGSVPQATVASLASGTYTVTPANAADTNYAAATSVATTTFVISNDSLTLSASPTSETYGANGSTTLTATLTTVGTTPTATGTITLTYTDSVAPPSSAQTITTINLTSCTNTVVGGNTQHTCTYNWTPPATATGATAGTLTISAAYSGNYTSGTATTTYTVNKAATTTGITVSPSVLNGNGETATFNISLTWAGSGLAPTGSFTVTYPKYNGGTITDTVVINSTNCPGYTATSSSPLACSYVDINVGANLPYGASTVTATYSGDNNYTTSSGTGTVIDSHYNTSTTASTTASVVYGQGSTATFQVTVTGSSAGNSDGEARPTGTITITNATLGTLATLTVNGSNCTTSGNYAYVCNLTYVVPAATAVANYTVLVSYSGDTYYAPSSVNSNLGVTAATTAVGTVTVNPSTVYPLGTATVSATLSWTGTGAAPGSGNSVLAFTASNNAANQASATFSNETCQSGTNTITCSATLTPNSSDVPGTQYSVTATYAATTNYAKSSNSGNWTYGITSQSVSTPTASPTSPSTYDTNVTFSTTHSYAGLTAPSGVTVTFTIKNGGTTVATLTASCGAYTANSQTCTASDALLPGSTTYTVTASVTADTTDGYASATSTGSLSYTVNQTYGGNVGVSATSETYPAAIPLSVTLSGYSSTATYGAAPPSGTVTFTVKQGTTTIGTATCNLPSTGTTATSTGCSTSYPAGLAAGSYTVTANYPGDGNYTSNSNSTSFTVTPATSSLLLSGSALGSNTLGTTSAALTATMTPAISGVTVTFTDTTNNVVIGTAQTNASGVASLTNVSTATAGVSGGIDVFTASIQAGTNYSANTSSGLTAYFQGLLVSLSNYHNFSSDPGTTDGTKLGPYGIVVSNFTSSAQTVALTVPPSSQGYTAFPVSNGCPTGSATLAAGATCSISFYYLPPYGDGVTIGGQVTQGQFEYSTYTISGGNSGNANGVGIISGGALYASRLGAINPGCSGFTPSSDCVAGGSGSLAGKAILASGAVQVNPGSLNFGTIAVNTTSGTQTVTVTNPSTSAPVGLTFAGPNSNQYTSNNQCGASLAAGASCQILFTFTPTTAGTPITASFTVTPNNGTVQTISLTGNAENQTGLTLSTNDHSFGTVLTGSSNAFGLTVKNSDTAAHTVAFSGTQTTGYSYTTTCPTSSTLAAGASCQLTMTYAPTGTGPTTDTVTVTSDANILPGGSTSVPVTFTGTANTSAQFTATSDIHNFGTVAVNSAATTYGVVLTNNSGTATTLSFPTTSLPSGFSIVSNNCPATLANGASCNLAFGFTPTASGYVTATYSINSSVALYGPESSTSPITGIQLRGTGQ